MFSYLIIGFQAFWRFKGYKDVLFLKFGFWFFGIFSS